MTKRTTNAIDSMTPRVDTLSTGVEAKREGEKPEWLLHPRLAEAEIALDGKQRTVALLVELQDAGLVMDDDGMVRPQSTDAKAAKEDCAHMHVKVEAAREDAQLAKTALLSVMQSARSEALNASRRPHVH